MTAVIVTAATETGDIFCFFVDLLTLQGTVTVTVTAEIGLHSLCLCGKLIMQGSRWVRSCSCGNLMSQ